MRSQLVDQVSLLRQELDWLYRRIDRSELQEAVTSPSLVSSLQAESQSKEIELARILSSHQSLHPGLATDPVRNGGANIELVQSQLGDSLLLEYFMASGLVIVGVFSQKRHEVLPIAVQSSVQDLQRRLWYYLHHERPPDEASPSRTDELPLQILRALYEELLQPIEGMLDGWPVIIAPHDVLFLVPFHALRGSEGHLVDRAPVSYVPSASALLKEATLDLARPGSVGVLGGSEPLDELQAFFLGGEEAQRVQLADNSASSESTRVATTLDVSAAHLIGQAKLRDDNPLFSEVTVGDTAVTLLDLCRTRPLSPLMTVEGTGFGASSPTAHTEVEGLWRALLTSGARSVLVPQGPTPPEVHRRHAELLYKELARGTTLAVAHREAMLSMRDADAGLHEWAAMFLVGDPLLTLWPQR